MLESLTLQTTASTWIALTLVLLLEAWWPIRPDWHPSGWLRLSAQRFAQLVHPSDQRANKQQLISGWLAYILFSLLWLAPLGFFYLLADYPLIFSSLILWISLYQQPWQKQAKLIASHLKHKQHQLAKERLSPWVNRDCTNLSSYGLEKATLEQLWFRLFFSWLGVLLWFILAGPLMAFLFRLATELVQAWPQKYKYWRLFGWPALILYQALSLPPLLLSYLLLASLYGFRFHRWPSLRKKWQQAWAAEQHKGTQESLLKKPSYELCYPLVAQVFQISLGGPAQYQGHTFRFPRFNPQQGRRAHSNQINRFILQLSWLKMVAYLLLMLLYFFVIN